MSGAAVAGAGTWAQAHSSCLLLLLEGEGCVELFVSQFEKVIFSSHVKLLTTYSSQSQSEVTNTDRCRSKQRCMRHGPSFTLVVNSSALFLVPAVRAAVAGGTALATAQTAAHRASLRAYFK